MDIFDISKTYRELSRTSEASQTAETDQRTENDAQSRNTAPKNAHNTSRDTFEKAPSSGTVRRRYGSPVPFEFGALKAEKVFHSKDTLPRGGIHVTQTFSFGNGKDLDEPDRPVRGPSTATASPADIFFPNRNYKKSNRSGEQKKNGSAEAGTTSRSDEQKKNNVSNGWKGLPELPFLPLSPLKTDRSGEQKKGYISPESGPPLDSTTNTEEE